MGDRNYHPNQYNPFTAQNYGYNQYQRLPQQQTPEPQAHPGPYFPNVPSQGAGFTVNTNIPVYNTGTTAQNPGTHSTSSMDQDYKPPPSYEESRSDRLLSKSKFSSPAWNYSDVKVEMDQSPQKHSFARDLFDMPGETRPVKKSPDWSSDNYCSSQSFKRESQERFDYSSSQSFKRESQERFNYNSSQSLKRESQERFDSLNRFSQPSDHAGQSNYRFSQNNQGGPSKNYQNRGRGRGRGGFRGRGHWQNNERQLNHEEHVDSKFDFEEQGQESDDEYGKEGTDEHPEKVNAFIPHPSIVSKYTYFPPSLEEMGEMFKDLVIYFFWKTPKNMKEKNPFVVICETFRRSAGYCNIDVEDGYDPRVKDRKFCTLRYNGMMMVRGVGENGCIKEARVRAGVSLINNLAMSCYTLKSKANYFSAEAFGQMQEIGSVPGIYILVPGQEAYDFESSRSYINRNLKEDSDVEYIFHFKNHKEALQFKGWARRQNLEFRFIKEGWYGVCRNRTTQYWRDKILASGTMESARYALLSPQGIGIEMFKNFDITSVVPKLKKVGPSRTPACIENLYGGPGEGPIINKARPPWERGNKGGKWKKTKTKKIMEQVQKGVPLHSVNAYKFLNKKKKKQLQKTLSRRLNINK